MRQTLSFLVVLREFFGAASIQHLQNIARHDLSGVILSDDMDEFRLVQSNYSIQRWEYFCLG